MTYLTNRKEFGRTLRAVDVNRFTADLCKAMGGKLLNGRGEQVRGSSFELDGAEISVHTIWNASDKVSLHIAAYPRNWLGSNEPHGDDYKLPSIRVSVERPMATLVKDIKRRLVAPAQAPLAKRREHAAKISDNAAKLKATSERLRKAYPHLDVRLENDATYNGTFYNREGVYLNGRFDYNGGVTIDRIGSLSAEQFDRVMDALYGSAR
jgi:hypothetical protein